MWFQEVDSKNINKHRPPVSLGLLENHVAADFPNTSPVLDAQRVAQRPGTSRPVDQSASGKRETGLASRTHGLATKLLKGLGFTSLHLNAPFPRGDARDARVSG